MSNVNTGNVLVSSIPTVAVTGLSAVVESATEVTLTWNELLSDQEKGYASITGYQISMDSGSGYLPLPSNATATDYQGITISGLTEGKTYYFKVAAINKHGLGPNTPSILVNVVLPPHRMLSVGVGTGSRRRNLIKI